MLGPDSTPPNAFFSLSPLSPDPNTPTVLSWHQLLLLLPYSERGVEKSRFPKGGTGVSSPLRLSAPRAPPSQSSSSGERQLQASGAWRKITTILH
ncbi:hypothetical protein K0M31_016519 [Melipona bicolor]|uniref:Uncharacterized protein n=1 Tax=Melipona bicolor TaxID=60889 RepID=A0AA40G8H9_9HYME|nr:hypothetical protein K0M31_016519 [Melipona bicolor]